jgi:hypothetical protein
MATGCSPAVAVQTRPTSLPSAFLITAFTASLDFVALPLSGGSVKGLQYLLQACHLHPLRSLQRSRGTSDRDAEAGLSSDKPAAPHLAEAEFGVAPAAAVRGKAPPTYKCWPAADVLIRTQDTDMQPGAEISRVLLGCGELLCPGAVSCPSNSIRLSRGAELCGITHRFSTMAPRELRRYPRMSKCVKTGTPAGVRL